MLQDKVLCHQPSGTIHRLLCELIRQTGQGSFPPPIISIWESIFMPPCSRQNSVGVVGEVERGVGKKSWKWKICQFMVFMRSARRSSSGYLVHLQLQCGWRTSTLCPEKCEEETGHKPVTIQTKEISFTTDHETLYEIMQLICEGPKCTLILDDKMWNFLGDCKKKGVCTSVFLMNV